MTMDVETLYELLFGRLPPAQAKASGRVGIIEGDGEALERFVKVFSFRPRREPKVTASRA